MLTRIARGMTLKSKVGPWEQPAYLHIDELFDVNTQTGTFTADATYVRPPSMDPYCVKKGGNIFWGLDEWEPVNLVEAPITGGTDNANGD
jgi:hypothetical protein